MSPPESTSTVLSSSSAHILVLVFVPHLQHLVPVMSTPVLISTFAPYPTLSLSAPSDASISTLYELVADRLPELPSDLVLTPHRGCVPSPNAPVSSLLPEDSNGPSFISLRLVPRLRGGKGGFGSQLRAAGGRMSSQKTSNNDSCRDLSGRRLSTIKEAKK